MYEKSEYLYDQNHWCKTILMVKIGYLIVSTKYKN